MQEARAVNPPISKRFQEQEVIDTIFKYYGNLSNVANALESTWQQVQVYLRKRPNVKQAVLDAREKILDIAEDKMIQLIQSEDNRVALEAAKFVLHSVGRSRGYCGDAPAMQVNVQSSGNDLKVQINSIFGIDEQQ